MFHPRPRRPCHPYQLGLEVEYEYSHEPGSTEPGVGGNDHEDQVSREAEAREDALEAYNMYQKNARRAIKMLEELGEGSRHELPLRKMIDNCRNRAAAIEKTWGRTGDSEEPAAGGGEESQEPEVKEEPDEPEEDEEPDEPEEDEEQEPAPSDSDSTTPAWRRRRQRHPRVRLTRRTPSPKRLASARSRSPPRWPWWLL